LIENLHLIELSNAFSSLVRGSDVPIDTVVFLSYANHLERVGMGVYAKDVVRPSDRIQGMYSKKMSLIHGFPLIGRGNLRQAAGEGAGEDHAVAYQGGQAPPQLSPSDLCPLHE
jgi:hypothetical protein